ncbi:hypothetical protein [Palleronia sp.]|uniref:hypothetical protein n=1 Tax=Palleronia sp. TaxID=1940284 RepID=UPI0035C83E73
MSTIPDSRGFDELREVLADFDQFKDVLPKRFNRLLFRRLRRLTGTQADWGQIIGVSQTTVGNWERGYTVPNRYYRRHIVRACEEMEARLASAYSDPQYELGHRIDPVATSRDLDHSILRAALTDFDYDSINQRIIPVPFQGDFDDDLAAEIAEDRTNLLESLARQAEFIKESLTEDSNLSERRLVRLLEQYAGEVKAEAPNPRLLNRFGSTISRVANSDDFRGIVNDIDLESIDGFTRDHLELMRLYFKEALSRAQEIDGSEVLNDAEVGDAEFRDIARIMEGATTASDARFVDPSIPTLLRDIATEIRDLNEAIVLTSDDRRANIFRRRRLEAFKNGGVYVGRFVFFGALLASVSVPGVVEIMGALSLIVAVTEGAAPGTIRDQYEKLREKFPALPSLPERVDENEPS